MDIIQAQKAILENLVALGRAGGMVNVIAVLKAQAYGYDEVFTIANTMQNLDWIKMIYCSFNANVINVELTLKGKEEYEKMGK